MKKFDELYNHINNEFNEQMNMQADEDSNKIDTIEVDDNFKKPTLLQVIRDIIEDEGINEINMEINYEKELYLPEIEKYVLERLDGRDYWTTDYSELVGIVIDALEDNNLLKRKNN